MTIQQALCATVLIAILKRAFARAECRKGKEMSIISTQKCKCIFKEGTVSKLA